tara:strand:+ start:435 stop:668 length:234 start_codon:yes stop_codon:yes gene_type:complete
MCSPFVRKEANRMFYYVKGHLIPITESDEVVEKYYDSYFKRLWCMYQGGDELQRKEPGFEAAWKEREAEMRELRKNR